MKPRPEPAAARSSAPKRTRCQAAAVGAYAWRTLRRRSGRRLRCRRRRAGKQPLVANLLAKFRALGGREPAPDLGLLAADVVALLGPMRFHGASHLDAHLL